jgi:hypothetical protein
VGQSRRLEYRRFELLKLPTTHAGDLGLAEHSALDSFQEVGSGILKVRCNRTVCYTFPQRWWLYGMVQLRQEITEAKELRQTLQS